ncbi:MAG: hypothetical protein AB1631_10250 [Acidobacteriota bacterium]
MNTIDYPGNLPAPRFSIAQVIVHDDGSEGRRYKVHGLYYSHNPHFDSYRWVYVLVDELNRNEVQWEDGEELFSEEEWAARSSEADERAEDAHLEMEYEARTDPDCFLSGD